MEPITFTAWCWKKRALGGPNNDYWYLDTCRIWLTQKIAKMYAKPSPESKLVQVRITEIVPEKKMKTIMVLKGTIVRRKK